jgi:hypothetical protein
MKITVSGIAYEYDSSKLMLSEARAIEKVCGCTFQEWSERLQTGSMEALAALIWLVQKRDNPELRFSDVDFEINSVEIEEDEEPEAGHPQVPLEEVTNL